MATLLSEVTRKLSDQMQVLSFVEKNINLRLYSRKQQQSGNHIGGRSSSTNAKHAISGFKSSSRQQGGKQ